jgi:hypothetical protein
LFIAAAGAKCSSLTLDSALDKFLKPLLEVALFDLLDMLLEHDRPPVSGTVDYDYREGPG